MKFNLILELAKWSSMQIAYVVYSISEDDCVKVRE
jgi:hypothetical protein